MVARQILQPKQPTNLYVTAGVSVLVVAAWLAGTLMGAWSPKRGLGRRPGLLRTARTWLQAHVYLGVVAFLAVLAHADFSWPHGGMGWWLLGLSFWTTATGLLGVWLQKWIPQAMAQGLKVEALYERIPRLVVELRGEADALVEDTSETLESFYQREVRPMLGRITPSWSYVLDVRAGRDQALSAFGRIRQFLGEDEREKLDDLVSIVTEKLELDALYRLQSLLRGWLLLHAPPAGLLMGLLVVHVYTWLRY